MELKKLREKLAIKLAIIVSVFLLLFSIAGPSAYAFTVEQSTLNQDGISVDVKQIKELATYDFQSDFATPSQALAQTIAAMVSVDLKGPDGMFTTRWTAQDVLKYLYPNYNDAQLKGATITPDQAMSWLHSVGYTASIVNRPLTTEEIKSNLDKSQPIVTVLANQNGNDWLEQNYAAVIYAHDDVAAGNQNLHASFLKSVNYGEAVIQDGSEGQAFTFPELTDEPDPMKASSTFKWVSTITDIKPDPSWESAQTIQGDKKAGIFAAHLTSSGNQSQLDFTDPAIKGLSGKFPDSNTDQVTKLDAVAIINLYEAADKQKTIDDLDNYLKVSRNTYVTTQQIMNWYQSLGFDFDVIKGKAPMSSTIAINKSGRVYLTIFTASKPENPIKNTAALGIGYLNNNTDGYRPYWSGIKVSDQVIPYYDTPGTMEGYAQYQKLAREFKYSNILGVTKGYDFSHKDKYYYSEDATIYNIRGKGEPDGTEVSNKPSTSVVTPPPATSNVKPAVNANYETASNFKVSETQGQEPWCSEYVQAAAVNTLENSQLTSAKQIMQLLNPGVSDEELATKGSGHISDNVNVLKNSYQVTEDIENRALSFDEVKKEIDAGGIIEMDENNVSSTPGSEEDQETAHAVAIVGYVLPSDNKGEAPYYEIWNPWWQGTFYMSSQSKTMKLGGIDYKWMRTWHNFRRIANSASQSIDENVLNQKTASASENTTVSVLKPTGPSPSLPQVSKITDSFLRQEKSKTGFNLEAIITRNKDKARQDLENVSNINTRVLSAPVGMNAPVAQMGRETVAQAYFFAGSKYGYAFSHDGRYMRARKDSRTKTIGAGNGIGFRDNVNNMNDNFDKTFATGVTTALVAACVVFFPEGEAIMSFINSLADSFVGKIITQIVGLPGSFKSGLLADFIVSLGEYLYYSYRAGELYDEL
ncbi:MAG: hypothetical protein LBV19_04865 [Streptococcaceae bacterium]|jgi:hypothetical protein|nr:hypothetical protein [Streptococcaceae bacterium]